MGKLGKFIIELFEIIIKFSKAFLQSALLLVCIFLLQIIRRFFSIGDQNLEGIISRISNYAIIVGFICLSFGSLLRNYVIEAKRTLVKINKG